MAHLPVTQVVIALDVGDRLPLQAQRLGRVDRRCRRCMPVRQPVEDVDDVGLGWDPCLQRQLNRAQDRLLIVLENKGKDLHHLPVAARMLEQVALQLRNASGISANGAPLRKAPGLRWITAR